LGKLNTKYALYVCVPWKSKYGRLYFKADMAINEITFMYVG